MNLVMFKELCKILKQEAVSSENAELALKIREKYVAGLSLNKIAELMHMSIYRVRKCLAADFFKDAKNERAMKFYLREGFVIRKKSVDSDTGEQEYKMTTIFP